MKRDYLGRINLDDFKELDHTVIGRKEKIWLNNDGVKYLFKSGASNYEIYAELIAEQLAIQCGFLTASYDLAIYKGKTGVITPSFLKFGDIIISGEKYLNNAKDIAFENNMNLDLSSNTINSILNAISIQSPNADIYELLLQLLKIFCFDLVILECDRNKTNWSIIRDINGKITLAPIYDCSTMARMNTDIDSLMKNITSENQIYNITDSIKYSLKLDDPNEENYFKDFSKLCDMFPDQIKIIIDGIKNINTDLAIKFVEDKINNEMEEKNFKIPEVIKFWLRKSIMTRKDEIIKIYINKLEKRKQK